MTWAYQLSMTGPVHDPGRSYRAVQRSGWLISRRKSGEETDGLRLVSARGRRPVSAMFHPLVELDEDARMAESRDFIVSPLKRRPRRRIGGSSTPGRCRGGCGRAAPRRHALGLLPAVDGLHCP